MKRSKLQYWPTRQDTAEGEGERVLAREAEVEVEGEGEALWVMEGEGEVEGQKEGRALGLGVVEVVEGAEKVAGWGVAEGLALGLLVPST